MSAIQGSSAPMDLQEAEGSTTRSWGVTVFRNAKGAPMASLGVHVDLHTPTLDMHLPLCTVTIGRNQWNGRRFVYHAPEPWSGHTDNCGCSRRTEPSATERTAEAETSPPESS